MNRYKVLYDDNNTGTHVLVTENGQAQKNHDTAVKIKKISDHKSSLQFYGPDGHAIQRCISGTVAAAFHLYKKHSITRHNLLSEYEGLVKETVTKKHTVSLRVQPIALQSSPKTVQQLFIKSSVMGCMETADPHGYIVAKVATKNALQDYVLAPEHIRVVGKRALIVSSFENNKLYYRYFAPHYGANETNCSGSSAFSLAAYWKQDLPPNQYVQCVQLSKHGATYELLTYANDTTAIVRAKAMVD